MKLYSMVIFHHGVNPLPAHLANAMDVSSFGWLNRGGAREVFLFISREVVKRAPINSVISLVHQVIRLFCDFVQMLMFL